MQIYLEKIKWFLNICKILKKYNLFFDLRTLLEIIKRLTKSFNLFPWFLDASICWSVRRRNEFEKRRWQRDLRHPRHFKLSRYPMMSIIVSRDVHLMSRSGWEKWALTFLIFFLLLVFVMMTFAQMRKMKGRLAFWNPFLQMNLLYDS
jgi:hypothetical protein